MDPKHRNSESAAEASGDSVPAGAVSGGGADSPGTLTAGIRILLAEDEPINRKVAVKVLEKLGHVVTVAANGAEAVEAWSAGTFDMILMDIQMPVMDGLRATVIIREKETDRRTPIIAMTAFAMKGDREKCREAGMDDYLSKPIDFEELKAVIEEFRPKDPERGTS